MLEKTYIETDIEKIMRIRLDKEGIPVIPQWPVRSGFEIDFAILPKKIGIECDGEKWHSSSKQKRKGRFRDWMLKRSGWTMLHFTGEEIHNDTDKCVSVVKEEIEKCQQKK